MPLSKTEFQELHAALLSAFPSPSTLKQMARFQLGENLDAIVGGGTTNEIVLNLIEWAEATGRTADLINGAREANSGNPALKAFAGNYAPAVPADSTPSNTNPTGGNRGDGDQVGGDKVGGDKVGGDKVGGDKLTAGDISGAAVAMGTGAQVNMTTNNYYNTQPPQPDDSTTTEPASPQGGGQTGRSPEPKEVFISYAWGGESEAIVDQLDQAFRAKGITILRDKRNVGYKERIRDFMRRLGQGSAVVVVISQKYLESENCMFELLEIADHGEFVDRIFPIVLSDAEIYDPIKRIRYIKYWEDKTKELDEAMRSVSSASLQGFRESIDLYTKIRSTFAEQADILADMNALTPETHRDSEFSMLINAVSKKLGSA